MLYLSIAGSRSGDVYPAPFVALNLPSSHDSATGGAAAVNGTALPSTHKNHLNKTTERVLQLDLDNAFKPPSTNSIKDFTPPVDPYQTRVPVEVKVAASLSVPATNHLGRGPVENGLNFGTNNNNNNGNGDGNGNGSLPSSGMFEFGGMALVSYQVDLPPPLPPPSPLFLHY